MNDGRRRLIRKGRGNRSEEIDGKEERRREEEERRVGREEQKLDWE